MLLRRLATALAVLLIAIAAIGALWTLRIRAATPDGAITFVLSIGLVALVIYLGSRRSERTETPYW